MARQYKCPSRKRSDPVKIDTPNAPTKAKAEHHHPIIELADSSTTSATPPNLLTLPRELRDKILKYLMVIGVVDLEVYVSRNPEYWIDDDPIPQNTTPEDASRSGAHARSNQNYRPSPQASAQLLRSCKMLYEQAHPTLYGDNIFYSQSWNARREDFLPFRCGLDVDHESKYRAIKHVYIGGGPWSGYEVWKMLRGLPYLRSCSVVGTGYDPVQKDSEALVRHVKQIYRSNRGIFNGARPLLYGRPYDCCQLGLVTRADRPGEDWALHVSSFSRGAFSQNQHVPDKRAEQD